MIANLVLIVIIKMFVNIIKNRSGKMGMNSPQAPIVLQILVRLL